MRGTNIVALIVVAATTLYAEDFSLTENGIGPINVHTSLTYDGKGERLTASATNDSGVSIPYVKLCVTADTKGCLFEMWTTEKWEAGKTLNWNVTSDRHVPNLSHQVKIAALNSPPVAPPIQEEKTKTAEPVQPPPAAVSKKAEPDVLTNAAVVRLTKAGLSEEVIVSMVNGQPGQYSVGADSIIALKESGVSEKVIAAMLSKTTVTPSQPAPPDAPGLHTTVSSRPTLALAGEPLVLHDATPVKLRLSRNLSSADEKTGDTVDFEVLEDVEVDGLVVVKRGSVAIGTVTQAEKKKRMARGGKLDVTIDSVRLVSDEKVALRGVKETAGGGHTGGMTAGIVVTALVVWPAAPFFLFMHGKDTVIPKGTEITAYVNGEVKLDRQKLAVKQL